MMMFAWNGSSTMLVTREELWKVILCEGKGRFSSISPWNGNSLGRVRLEASVPHVDHAVGRQGRVLVQVVGDGDQLGVEGGEVDGANAAVCCELLVEDLPVEREQLALLVLVLGAAQPRAVDVVDEDVGLDWNANLKHF
jgi:hypothetical protein